MSATTYHSTVANAVIDAIRAQVAVRKEVLDAAKHRRDRVRPTGPCDARARPLVRVDGHHAQCPQGGPRLAWRV
jgi:hypothetical protein